ncbi:PleD family two-component system response regulator [Planctomycetota bacterium]
MNKSSSSEDDFKKKMFIRGQIITRLTRPKEVKSALLKVLSSEYIRKKCRLTIYPSDEFFDDLTEKINNNLSERSKVQIEAERLLKKDEYQILASAFEDQIKLLSLTIREVLAKKFMVDIDELDEKLVNSLLGIQEEPGAVRKDYKKIIFVVDDDPKTRNILRHILKKNKFKVIEAENGDDAFYRLGNNKADLILLDINMPRMDGKEFLRRIKSNPSYRDIPIVMISAHGDSETVQETIQLGARDFIIKPFSSNILNDKISNILDS